MQETKYKLTVSHNEAHNILDKYVSDNKLRNTQERHQIVNLMSSESMTVVDIHKTLLTKNRHKKKISKATIYNFLNNFKEAGIFSLDENVVKIDFKQLREDFYNEHVSRKTTDGIPVVCTHPHNLFEWFKNEITEYIK